LYSFRTTFGPVELAFTDRLGGVSAAPYDELNLSIAGDDDTAAKAENHRLVIEDFAPGLDVDRIADLYQVHGARVVPAAPGVRPEADGIVTTEPDMVLLVRAADCVPVLLADAGAGVIGAAHAGRLGMALGVVPGVVARMREMGATEVRAWIGPAICGSCYEVPATLRDEVAEVEPASRATTSWGTPALDVVAGVAAQLERAGVPAERVGRCTRESADLYSFRRDGEQAGRLAGLIRLRPAGAVQ
jgi:YfiH family protein